MKTNNLILTLGLIYLVYKITNQIPIVSKNNQKIIKGLQSNISDCSCKKNNLDNDIYNNDINYYQPQTIDFNQYVPTPATVIDYQPTPKFKFSYVC